MGTREESPESFRNGEYTLKDALGAALAQHQAGNFRMAESIYTQILAQFPKCQEALNYFGILCHQLGRTEEGTNLLREAVSVDPDYTDAWSNLGNLLIYLGRDEEADEVYRKVIRQDPEHVNALANLGTVSKILGRHEKAEEYFRRALDLDPNHVEANRNFGNLLIYLKRDEEAVACYQTALENDPQDSNSYRAFGRAYRAVGNDAGAMEIYRRWLQLDPGSATARHHLAALTGEDVPERASADYIREEFDGFAGSFDTVLKKLEYRAPKLCEEALRAEIPEADGTRAILDAGCGTGLCGEFLRSHAKVLTGVDLSRKMVDRARLRREYDDLIVGDLLEYLPDAGPFDVVLSADTLCYFGDLVPVLSGMVGATAGGGLVIFTVEAAEDDVPGFEIHRQGRYRHSERGLKTTLEGVGLEVRGIVRETLRTEGGEKVNGFVVTARKP